MALFYDAAPAATAEQLAEAVRLKAAAADARHRSAESFRNSDTDGFLSQWSSDISARKYDVQAGILEDGGCSQFSVLCDSKGNVVTTKYRYFNVDDYRPWLGTKKVWDIGTVMAEQLGRRWIPSGERSRIQKQFGFHEERRWFPAEAAVTTGRNGGRGLSGAANAYVGIFRVDMPREWQY